MDTCKLIILCHRQNFEIPDVQGYAVDRYIREHFNVRGPRPFFPFEPKTTLFSIWIGTSMSLHFVTISLVTLTYMCFFNL